MKTKKRTEKEIRNEFKQLGLNEINSLPYRGAQQFSQNFERCTLYKSVPLKYSAGATDQQ